MTTAQSTITVGSHVETHIAAPHPAAFAGIVLAIGGENGRILVQGWSGIERAYTPESLRIVVR
jgi:hypothetical protein